jgi:hypothetical protein
MAPYPVTYEADYAEERSRLTTFFRFLTVIPVALVVYVLSLGVIVTLPVTWLVMVITGGYLPSLYRYHTGLLRAWARVGAYCFLITDAYPPFGIGEDAGYPVRVAVAPMQDSYSRLLAFVRLVLYIPVYLIAYVLMLVSDLIAFCAWVVIVFTGRQVPAFQSLINMGMAWQVRSYAYLMLLTERFPPVGEIAMELEPRAPQAEPPEMFAGV